MRRFTFCYIIGCHCAIIGISYIRGWVFHCYLLEQAQESRKLVMNSLRGALTETYLIGRLRLGIYFNGIWPSDSRLFLLWLPIHTPKTGRARWPSGRPSKTAPRKTPMKSPALTRVKAKMYEIHSLPMGIWAHQSLGLR